MASVAETSRTHSSQNHFKGCVGLFTADCCEQMFEDYSALTSEDVNGSITRSQHASSVFDVLKMSHDGLILTPPKAF